MRRARQTGLRQRGVALIALAAVLAVGASWWMVSALQSAGGRTAADRLRNGELLQQAKFALVGWVAARALESGESNPGRLPCPEAAGYVGTSNEGIAAGNCTLPAVGRLPWRTLGLERPRDAAGEPLWYVVSPGWALPSVSSTLNINSNTPGQLTLNGVANASVALIIAPGAAMNVSPTAAQQAVGCTSRIQRRTSGSIDARDYLECENASSADGVFASDVAGNAINPVLNDQVLSITTADVLPGIEAAISARITRDIAPALESVYAGSKWGTTASAPVFPFATPFSNPGTSNYRGTAGTTQGLLPFSHSQGCTPASDPRCLTGLHAWTGSSVVKIGGLGSVGAPLCGMSGGLRYCYGLYLGNAVLEMRDTISNVAAALKDYDSSGAVGYLYYMDAGGTWRLLAPTLSQNFASDGSLVFKVSGTVPDVGLSTYYWFYSGRPTFSDHALLDAANATTGWFVRNEWYRLVYYAYSASHAAAGSLNCSGASCVRIDATAGGTDYRRAILVLAGRSVNGSARPSANLADYLENAQNRDGDPVFNQDRLGRTSVGIFNDRVIAVGPPS